VEEEQDPCSEMHSSILHKNIQLSRTTHNRRKRRTHWPITRTAKSCWI